MGEHRPLRSPGRARGVDDGGDVVGVDGVGPVVEHGGVLGQLVGGEVGEVGEVADEVVVEPFAPVEDEHPLQPRDLAAPQQHLRQLVEVLDEQIAALRVIEDERDLARRVGGVHRHRDPACGEDAEVGEVPLAPVAGEDPDPVAGDETEADEPGRHVGARAPA